MILPLLLFLACSTVDEPVKSVSYATPEVLLAAWNDATNNRNFEALATMYSPQVYYYGKVVSRETLIDKKRSYLLDNPNFQQTVEAYGSELTYAHSAVIKFDKSYTYLGSPRTTFATLSLLEDDEGGWRISSETDIETQKKHPGAVCDCKDFWFKLMIPELARTIRFHGRGEVLRYEYYPDQAEVRIDHREVGEHFDPILATYVFDTKSGTYHKDLVDSAPYDQTLYARLAEFCR